MKQSRIIQIVIVAVNLALAIICLAAYSREDRVKPEFLFQSSEYVYTESDQTDMLLRDITAQDDRDGDITERIVIEKVTENRSASSVIVYYAVCDSAGNVAKISRVFPARFDQTVHGEAAEVLGEAQIPAVETLESRAAKEQAEGSDETEDDDGREDSGEQENGDSQENEAEEDSNDQDETEKRSEETKEAAGNDREKITNGQDETAENGDDEGEKAEAPNGQPQEPAQPETQPASGSSAPVLTLREQEVTIEAGTSPPWTELIETLRDDKDDYTTLYYNLSVSRFNRNQPGDYPVTLYTEDSDGNRSGTVTILVHVKENG